MCIKETFPIWMDILGTLLPLAGRRLFLKVEDSECSRGGEVVEGARTPPAAERLLVP